MTVPLMSLCAFVLGVEKIENVALAWDGKDPQSYNEKLTFLLSVADV